MLKRMTGRFVSRLLTGRRSWGGTLSGAQARTPFLHEALYERTVPLPDRLDAFLEHLPEDRLLPVILGALMAEELLLGLRPDDGGDGEPQVVAVQPCSRKVLRRIAV